MPRLSVTDKHKDGSGGGGTISMNAIFRLTNKLASKEFSHPLSEWWIATAIEQELLTIKMRQIRKAVQRGKGKAA